MVSTWSVILGQGADNANLCQAYRVVANAGVIHFVSLIILICNFLIVLFPVKTTTFLNRLHTLYPTNLTLYLIKNLRSYLQLQTNYKFHKKLQT